MKGTRGRLLSPWGQKEAHFYESSPAREVQMLPRRTSVWNSSQRAFNEADDNGSSTKKARMDEISRVLMVEIRGVPMAEKFELGILHETKQAKVRSVPQRLSIWNVCTWKGVAHDHPFESGVLEAIRSNKCFVAMVRAESAALDEIVEDCSGSGHVICLAEEGGNVPQLEDLHVLFVPFDTSAFREVFYFMHSKMPSTTVHQVFQGFLVVGSNLLPPDYCRQGFVGETNGVPPPVAAQSPMSTSPSQLQAAPAPAPASRSPGGQSLNTHTSGAGAGGGGGGRGDSPNRRSRGRSSSRDRRDRSRGRDSPRRRGRSRSPGSRNGGGGYESRLRSPPRNRSPARGGGSYVIRRGKKSCCWGQRCYGKPVPEGNGKCIHLHPGDFGYTATKECNFGNDCRKRKEKQCIFIHPDEMGRGGGGDRNAICRFGSDCRDYRNNKCDRIHPSGGRSRSRSRNRSRGRDRSRSRSSSRSSSRSGGRRRSR